MRFVVATNNRDKLLEIAKLLESLGHSAVSLREAGIAADPKETGKTFLENALIKAREVLKLSGTAVIADDSGLRVEALDGEPGVHTARYAGDECDNQKNIGKLLSKLSGVPPEERTAWFVSAVAAILPDGTELTASGVCRGSIGFHCRGDNGFGYDPVFCLRDGRSFAELTDREKNSVSHRARALRKLGFMLRNITRVR